MRTRTPWPLRAALHFVPYDWRTSVRDDLIDEAGGGILAGWWCAIQAIGVAISLHWTFTRNAMWTDIRYAVRSLLRAPGFTAAAVLTLVFGIGVNIAVFTVVDRALFRPLPFGDVGRLVFITPYDVPTQQKYTSFSKQYFVEARQLPMIKDMAFAGFTRGFTIGAGPNAASMALTMASYNLLDVLETNPVIGRRFSHDDAMTNEGVVMITSEVWRARFGADPLVLGRTVNGRTVNGVQETAIIVGVLPAGFIVPQANRSAKFDGLVLEHTLLDRASVREAVDPSVARLAPGVSIAEAQRELDVLGARIDDELRQPGQTSHRRVLVESLRAGMFWFSYRYLWMVTLAASLVGVLACANLSSLLLARGRSREQQVALAAALGASTTRLIVAELVQCLVLGLVATAISLVVLYWTSAGLRTLAPAPFRQFVESDVDLRVTGFAVSAALATSVLGAILPAWRTSQTNLLAVLQRAGGAPSHARRSRGSGVVLAFEAAAGVVLVAGAAIVVRSFIGLVRTDVGFAPANALVLNTEPIGNKNDGVNLPRYLHVLDALRSRPDIAAVAGIDSMPSAGAAPVTGAKWNDGGYIGVWQMTDGLLDTIGARVIAGHDISRADLDAGRPVALITETAARRLWPDSLPSAVLGRELIAPKQLTRQIIGVVADIRDRPDQAAEPRIFIPATPADFWYLEFAVRPRGIGLDSESVRRQLAACCGVTAVQIAPAGSSITSALQQPRTQAIIFTSFAVVGLLLAALGLFAVASFDIALRRYEMGVRVALGASANQIRRLIVMQCLRPVAAGAMVGVCVAFWAAKSIEALVYHVNVRDPWTLAFVVVILLAVAALAAWLPARRAARADPAVVLRSQ